MSFQLFFSLFTSALVALGWYLEGRLAATNWFLPLLFLLGEMVGGLLMAILSSGGERLWRRLKLPLSFNEETVPNLAPVFGSFSFQAIFYFFSLWLVISNETVFAHGMVLIINGYFLKNYYSRRREEKTAFLLALFALALLVFLVVR